LKKNGLKKNEMANYFRKIVIVIFIVLFNLTFSKAQTNVTTIGGTSNYLPKFNGTSSVISSIIYETSSKIGVGTTTPSEVLSVSGNLFTSGNVKIDGTHLIYHSSNGVIDWGNGSGDLIFRKLSTEGDVNTFTQLAILKNGGNFGLLTTDPGSRLQINGNAAVGYSSNTAAPTNGLCVSGYSAFGTTDPLGYQMYVNGTSFFNGVVKVNGTPAQAGKLNAYSADAYAISGQTLSNNPVFSAGVFEGTATGIIALAGFHSTGSFASEARAVYGYAGNGTTANGTSIGVVGESSGDYYSIGVKGIPGASANFQYGVYGVGGGGGYAGYFAGDVYCTGDYLPSDERLKENIKSLDNPLDKLLLLKPKSYNYKNNEELKYMHLSKVGQMGFLAQDLEKVFPDLVKKTLQPAEFDKNGKIISASQEFKAINYLGLIPVIVGSMQEHDIKIKTLEEKIDSLISVIENIKSILGAEKNLSNSNNNFTTQLMQNVPNPANGQTEISYNLPPSYSQATIIIYDLNGKQIKKYNLTGSGKGKITIFEKELNSGMYIYSLIIDNILVDSKRMVITD
jgi:hypothetical protein